MGISRNFSYFYCVHNAFEGKIISRVEHWGRDVGIWEKERYEIVISESKHIYGIGKYSRHQQGYPVNSTFILQK